MIKKIIVGLTGGIASGKTMSMLMFEELGAKGFYCDKIAHLALRKNTKTYFEIKKNFGKTILNRNGSINRFKLAEIIFKYKRKRKQLENIVHPFVFNRIFEIMEKTKGIVFIEIPLLFETGFQKYLDYTIVTNCSFENQIKRLCLRDDLTEEEALLRIQAQMPLEEKAQEADFIINTDTIAKASKDIKKIWNKLSKKIKM